MTKLKFFRLLKTFSTDLFRGNFSRRNVSTIALVLTSFVLIVQLIGKGRESIFLDGDLFEINNFGPNVNVVNKSVLLHYVMYTKGGMGCQIGPSFIKPENY